MKKQWKAGLLGLLLATPVYATDVQFDWTQQLEREDGTPATIDEIGEYKIYSVPLNFPGGAIDSTAAVFVEGIAGTDNTFTYSNIEGFSTEKKVAFVMTVVDTEGLESTSSLVQILNLASLRAPGFQKPKVILRMNP